MLRGEVEKDVLHSNAERQRGDRNVVLFWLNGYVGQKGRWPLQTGEAHNTAVSHYSGDRFIKYIET